MMIGKYVLWVRVGGRLLPFFWSRCDAFHVFCGHSIASGRFCLLFSILSSVNWFAADRIGVVTSCSFARHSIGFFLSFPFFPIITWCPIVLLFNCFCEIEPANKACALFRARLGASWDTQVAASRTVELPTADFHSGVCIMYIVHLLAGESLFLSSHLLALLYIIFRLWSFSHSYSSMLFCWWNKKLKIFFYISIIIYCYWCWLFFSSWMNNWNIIYEMCFCCVVLFNFVLLYHVFRWHSVVMVV